jgi:hypothetical protein
VRRKKERGGACGRCRLEDRELRSLEVGGKRKNEGSAKREERRRVDMYFRPSS